MTKMIGVFSGKEPVQFLAETYCRLTLQHKDWDVTRVIQAAQTNVALYQLLQQYEVRAKNVADFIRRYKRHDRKADNAELLSDCEQVLQEQGYLVITHNNSTTGRTVSYYGRTY